MVTIKDLGEYTFPSLLNNSVRKFKTRPALSLVDGDMNTYQQVYDKAKLVANMLNNLGIKGKTNVGILASGMPEWGISYLGIVCYGRTAVPLLTEFSMNELETIFAHSNMQVLFIERKLLRRFEKDLGKFPDIIIEIEDFKIIKGPEEFIDKTILDFEVEKSLKMSGDEEDLASIIYTSGTTGRSKGVMLTHKNLVWTAIQSQSTHQVTKRYRLLSFLPLAHVYEFTTNFTLQLLNGSCVYYLGKPPVVSVLLPAFKKVKPNAILSVPLVMEKIYKNKIVPLTEKNEFIKSCYQKEYSRKLINKIIGIYLKKTFGGHLKFFGIGGSKIDPKVELFMKEAGFPYAIGYGLTETSPLLATSGPKITIPGTIGVVMPGVDLRINNPDSKSGVGEIVVKGSNVMKGYYKNDELTHKAFTLDSDSVGKGYFKTGDLGIFKTYRNKPYLILKGRSKSMILGANGENIYPEDIEFVINQHPLVSESLVVEDEGSLKAIVQLDESKIKEIEKENKSFAERFPVTTGLINKAINLHESISTETEKIICDIKKYVNGLVNKNSQINKIEIVQEFQKTATHKIKRYLYEHSAAMTVK